MRWPRRCNALASALQGLPGGAPMVVGIMCCNHRGFVESLVAANRIGCDIVVLNTSFAGPALADVLNREGVDAVIYDEEFTDTMDRALADTPEATRIVAWADRPHEVTVEKLIAAHTGQQPERTGRKGKMILLTSGTTGTPKGAKQSGGNARIGTLKAILDRTPWRAEEPIVIVAPMFHAWGFSQLLLAASSTATGQPAWWWCRSCSTASWNSPPRCGSVTAASRYGSPPHPVHGCDPTSSSLSWTSSVT